MKAVNQLLCGVHIAASAEALALARPLGLDPAAALETFGAGAAESFMLGDRGPRMLRAYDDGAEVRSRLDILVKDMGIVTAPRRRCTWQPRSPRPPSSCSCWGGSGSRGERRLGRHHCHRTIARCRGRSKPVSPMSCQAPGGGCSAAL